LKEKYTIKVSEHKILKKIFGPKKGEASGQFMTMHIEEHRGIYGHIIVIKAKSGKIRWDGHVVRAEEMENTYTNLAGKLIEKRLLGSHV
jgi:hypothetical protein